MIKRIRESTRYAITDDGRVFNVETGHEMKQMINANGYYYVQLIIEGKHRCRMVHRLKAEAFIPNPDGKPYVNHIDGNKLNNELNNLEWVTASENTSHAAKVLGVLMQFQDYNKRHQKRVQGTFADGTTTEIFESASAASKAVGVTKSCIINSANGVKKRIKGATWKYI